MHKYCSVCGKKMVNKNIREYDRETGKPIYNKKCGSGLCGHDGIFHDFKSKGRFLSSYQECSKCGYKYYPVDDMTF